MEREEGEKRGGKKRGEKDMREKKKRVWTRVVIPGEKESRRKRIAEKKNPGEQKKKKFRKAERKKDRKRVKEILFLIMWFLCKGRVKERDVVKQILDFAGCKL